ncbi:dTDP-4-dehydrorhamnose reductase [Ralstonia mannitolilytica]|uniref:dTDP-4-dehydrorhamnose reductase n=1 Tax=Ralstonia mannitolilytica TaxID=105219 RepID=UPI0028F636B1|nr:dTDP-4-dehydrorhamnose reductase [Ralstonia mannitolilytica]CAJ0889034.1 dTDP-4-dehydrorhamnose reductase [Ralstonia mannitolilytica]
MLRKSRSIPKFLVTGSNGQVGFELRRSLAPLGEVIALDRATCDLTQLAAVRRVVREHRPNVIVNAGAYTAVGQAEGDAATAFAVNATAVGVLAEEARALGGLLVHYSTDYVFDGTKPEPYVETDATNPQTVYGKSKLAGEHAIAASGAKAFVLRTSWVAGVHGENFVRKILRLARERDHLHVVSDQVGAPTTADLVADVTAYIVRRWVSDGVEDGALGVYHVSAAGETTWHSCAMEIIRYVEARGMPLRTALAAVNPITSDVYAPAVQRPLNSRLNTSKLVDAFDLDLPDWQRGMWKLLDRLLLE